MGQVTQENGNTITPVAQVNSIIKMETFTKVLGRIMNIMDTEFT